MYVYIYTYIYIGWTRRITMTNQTNAPPIDAPVFLPQYFTLCYSAPTQVYINIHVYFFLFS